MEGGTFYKKGAEANLVNPSTKKGQKKSRQQSQEPQQPQPELNLNLSAQPPAQNKQDGILVTIHALLSPEWKFAQGEFMAVSSSINNWVEIVGYVNQVGGCGPDDLYTKVWVQIDVPVAASHKPIAYKFLKIFPRRTPPEYEHLGSRSGYNVNRRLEIPEDRRYKGGTFTQYDNVIHPKSSGGFFSSLKRTVKDLIGGVSVQVFERHLSIVSLLPSWDFTSKESVFTQRDEIYQVYRQLNHAQVVEIEHQRWYTFNVDSGHMPVNQAILDRYFLPGLEQLLGAELEMKRDDRLMAAVLMCMVLRKLGLHPGGETSTQLVRLLRLDINEERRECPQLQALEPFSEKERREMAASILYVVNIARDSRRQSPTPYWQFLFALPLLHILQGKIHAFAVSVDRDAIPPGPDSWFAHADLSGSVCPFDDKTLEEAATQLRPCIAVD
ncbi:uncharacterized protein LOC135830645, partial [Sycon ciliatum]|uniref:uncharacterized protein LOC135830645 n=1 Tax=Sycon ciliatum TaxID=27933 RepID=UPI0031F6E354